MIFRIVVLTVFLVPGVAASQTVYAANTLGKVSRPAEASVERPVKRSQWTKETKLWLARSCVGEAGFSAMEECLGIAWVYAVRVSETRMSLLKTIKKYSSAVKGRSTRKRKWILKLELSGEEPEHWPTRLKWGVHKRLWKKMLAMLEEWARGEHPNPVRGANHFGGWMDRPGARWVRIHPEGGVEFKNRFYRSPSAVLRWGRGANFTELQVTKR